MCGYFNRAWLGRSICCSCPHGANMADSLMADARWQCRGTVTKHSHPQLFRLPSSHGTKLNLCISCFFKDQGRIVQHRPMFICHCVSSTCVSLGKKSHSTYCPSNLFLAYIHKCAAWGVNTGNSFVFMWLQDRTGQRGAVLHNNSSCFLISPTFCVPGVLPGKLRHSGVS